MKCASRRLHPEIQCPETSGTTGESTSHKPKKSFLLYIFFTWNGNPVATDIKKTIILTLKIATLDTLDSNRLQIISISVSATRAFILVWFTYLFFLITLLTRQSVVMLCRFNCFPPVSLVSRHHVQYRK